jgi:hypothetical protein
LKIQPDEVNKLNKTEFKDDFNPERAASVALESEPHLQGDQP